MHLNLFSNKCEEIDQKYTNQHSDSLKKKGLRSIIKKMKSNRNIDMDEYITSDEIQKSTLILRGINKSKKIDETKD